MTDDNCTLCGVDVNDPEHGRIFYNRVGVLCVQCFNDLFDEETDGGTKGEWHY